MEGIGRLREAFVEIRDPRAARGVRHEVVWLLVLTVLSVLAGAANYRELGDRAREFEQPVLGLCGARFHPVLGVWEAPSSATIRRVVQAVDAAVLDRAVGMWLRELVWLARTARARAQAVVGPRTARSGTGEVPDPGWCSGYGPVEGIDGLAVDGKTVCNSGDGDPVANVRLFSALLHREKIIVAQIVVPSETTEVTCLRELLKDQPLMGVTVTADAAHTVEDTATYLTAERGGDYVLMVKANQPTLMVSIAARMPAAAEGSADHLDEVKVNGQRVVREIWVVPADDAIVFPAAAQVFRIRRRVFELTGQCLSKEIVHGVTSLRPGRANAADLATFVRQHWLIESQHWLRDTAFREDHQFAHTGTGAHALAALRNLALGILRLASVTKIRATLQQHATDRTRITRLLDQVTSPQSMIN